MEEFVKGLCCSGKSNLIPDTQNIFGTLIGEWDIEWIDHLETDSERHIKGEWIFSWILEGIGIQDLFIVPSRAERAKNSHSDAEYGTTIRLYNPQNLSWDIFYGCLGAAYRLTAQKMDSEIVITENGDSKMKWIFSEITATTFQWRKEVLDDSKKWKVEGKVVATRKKMFNGS